MERWKHFVNKKVYVELNSGRKYTGKVIAVDDPKSSVVFFYLKDKYEEMVIFPVDEIKLIQEERA